jgi:ABC-type microcin C transport system duplicated ATPase subunit YejF
VNVAESLRDRLDGAAAGPPRLNADQLLQIARSLRAKPQTDARTAQAVASALESVALRRATRERLRREFGSFPSFRRAAKWATSTF